LRREINRRISFANPVPENEKMFRTYPGTPSSEVIDTLRAQPDRAYYLEFPKNSKR
jgi:TPP-dependent indolepyruvate ferredoxin oxidoreductase alpha subunit